MVLNLVLRFLLEVCGLVAVGYWGFQTGNGTILKIILGLGGPILMAVIWGIFGSPAAPFPVHGFMHLLLEILIFGVGGLALYFAGRPTLATIYAILVVLNRVLMHLWDQ